MSDQVLAAAAEMRWQKPEKKGKCNYCGTPWLTINDIRDIGSVATVIGRVCGPCSRCVPGFFSVAVFVFGKEALTEFR